MMRHGSGNGRAAFCNGVIVRMRENVHFGCIKRTLNEEELGVFFGEKCIILEIVVEKWREVG